MFQMTSQVDEFVKHRIGRFYFLKGIPDNNNKKSGEIRDLEDVSKVVKRTASPEAREEEGVGTPP